MGKIATTSHQRQRVRLAIGDSTPSTLHGIIEFYSPLSHWPMRETSGTTLDDIGSLNNDSTGADSNTVGDATAPDGQPCPLWAAAALMQGGSAPDQAGYTPAAASGLTVVFGINADTGSVGGNAVAKRADNGTVAEWEIGWNNTGVLYALTRTSANGVARQITANASALADNTWALVIVRFDSSATGYPNLRVNGVAIAQTQSGSGTARGDDAGRLQIGQLSSGSTRVVGKMAQLGIFAGQLSDGQCAIIEAVADAEGWF